MLTASQISTKLSWATSTWLPSPIVTDLPKRKVPALLISTRRPVLNPEKRRRLANHPAIGKSLARRSSTELNCAPVLNLARQLSSDCGRSSGNQTALPQLLLYTLKQKRCARIQLGNHDSRHALQQFIICQHTNQQYPHMLKPYPRNDFVGQASPSRGALPT